MDRTYTYPLDEDRSFHGRLAWKGRWVTRSIKFSFAQLSGKIAIGLFVLSLIWMGIISLVKIT